MKKKDITFNKFGLLILSGLMWNRQWTHSDFVQIAGGVIKAKRLVAPLRGPLNVMLLDELTQVLDDFTLFHSVAELQQEISPARRYRGLVVEVHGKVYVMAECI